MKKFCDLEIGDLFQGHASNLYIKIKEDRAAIFMPPLYGTLQIKPEDNVLPINKKELIQWIEKGR